MPAAIPGYYFDSTKNRYFRIQTNHAAPPGSKYSLQSVNARTALDREDSLERASQFSKRETQIHRSELFNHPLLNFSPRLGVRRFSPGDYVASYFSNAVQKYDVFSYQGARTPGIRSRSTFDIEPETKNLFIGPSTSEEKSISVWSRHSKNVSSLYGQCKRATIKSPAWPTFIRAVSPEIFVWITESTSTDVWIIGDLHNLCRSDNLSPPAPLYASMRLSLPMIVSELVTSPDKGYLALATENGLQIRDASNSNFGDLLLQTFKGREQMTVQFKDRNTYMSGTRSGRVNFGDVRGGHALRLKHSSAITALRILKNDNCILVNGLEHMRIYDLRFARAATVTEKRKARSDLSTTPLVDFCPPPSRTQKQYGLGFDYDPELNLIASASTDFSQTNRVTLWSAMNGKMLPSPLNNFHFPAPVDCIMFARLRDNASSIMMSCEGHLEEWTPQGVGIASPHQE